MAPWNKMLIRPGLDNLITLTIQSDCFDISHLSKRSSKFCGDASAHCSEGHGYQTGSICVCLCNRNETCHSSSPENVGSLMVVVAFHSCGPPEGRRLTMQDVCERV